MNQEEYFDRIKLQQLRDGTTPIIISQPFRLPKKLTNRQVAKLRDFIDDLRFK